jgi:S-adenosylhomocysteine hydrolase
MVFLCATQMRAPTGNVILEGQTAEIWWCRTDSFEDRQPLNMILDDGGDLITWFFGSISGIGSGSGVI